MPVFVSKFPYPLYKYLSGKVNRQDYLETAIKWISNGRVDDYMGQHQHEPNASELWLYFQNVIHWIEVVFPNYRPIMKGRQWGELYNEFKDHKFNAVELEDEIKTLLLDKDVTNDSGVYEYVLTRDEKHLNIREFDNDQKLEAYERQNGICIKCGKHFEIEEMEGDHITPWHEGGKTTAENCQMLCRDDNRRKSGK
jgi:hypothetical protein